ncbi:MAG: putative Ig domain-containing protein [Pseudomonadota bacterium]|nr:putative Ig domain-containing protein [Pseudomonadota bacterium]
MSSTRIKPILIVCLLAAAGAQAATTAQIDDARAKGLAWLIQNQKGDGSWYADTNLKMQATVLALAALRNAGVARGETYSAGVAWMSNAEPGSADALARQIAMLAQASLDTSAKVATLQSWQSPQDGGWGPYKQYYPAIPDTALAIEAIVQAGYATDPAALTLMLMNRRHADGGWGYGEETASRLIPTAQAVLALARYRSLVASVDGDLTAGVNWLLAKQKTDAGFAEDANAAGVFDSAKSGQAYETALVYQALRVAAEAGNVAAAGAGTARDNALNYLVAGAGKPGADGSWSSDPLTTGLALAALASTTLADTDSDGIPDLVEAHLATSTMTADGRQYVPGNGQHQTGVNTPLLLPPATVGSYYTHSLTQADLIAYNWASGSLPPGLTLNTSGQLSGTPTQTGAFNFGYSASPSFSQLAQLTVEESVSDGDVPLPGWALVLLGSGLLGSLLRRQTPVAVR